MANYAHLYFTDSVSALTLSPYHWKADGTPRSCIDSRNQLPLAWLLFFRPEDVWLLHNSEDDFDNLCLVRHWEPAQEKFQSRAPLLLDWFRGEISASDVDIFFGWLQSLREAPNGVFLVADVGEIAALSALWLEEDVFALRAALAALDDDSLDVNQKFERLDFWSHSRASYKSLTLHDVVFCMYYGEYGGE